MKRVVLAAVSLALLAAPIAAHHIMGIPHYAYDKHYPQAPVITYKVGAGPYLLEMTGYPGKPVPKELTQIHAYIYKKADKSSVFAGPVRASVARTSFGRRELVYGPVETRFEERLHKFSPVYGEAGDYVVRLELEIEGRPYEVDLPIRVGDPSNPLVLLGSWGGALVLLVVVLRAVKIKRARLLAAA